MKKIILICLILLTAISGCTSNSDHEHSDDELHDHSVEIEGSAMKQLTVQQVADLWEIDSQKLLDGIVEEFEFKGNYTTETTLEKMREEYKFSPAIIKDIAEEIKKEPELGGV
ncbi:MAG: hypothetical protein KAR87_00615 [Candidatus Aenigmarchaeota archaeon]|nr:hypothetical protein [Candidatus Aenigmarchaeota archaeon]MCK5177618.1 hypothetical protein [Candidatus Aenigmarchaeota archaeon]